MMAHRLGSAAVAELPLIPDPADALADIPPPDASDNVAVVRWYHEHTKHHLHRYAPAPGQLDWANQPDPFRTYAGAPIIELPLFDDRSTPTFADLYRPGAVSRQPVDRSTVAALFELSLGLSAWKEFRGNRWALRCNPSSGNLHPTEGYAILPTTHGLPASVYHYLSRDHVLERRCTLTDAGSRRLAEALSPGTLLVGLSSVHWREAWKYGERAFRYCQHDVGHAIAAVRYAAAALGWSARLLDQMGDDEVSTWLGCNRVEADDAVAPDDREHPDAILLVGPDLPTSFAFDASSSEVLEGGSWAGRPNVLSPDHVTWKAIGSVAAATVKPRTAAAAPIPSETHPALDLPDDSRPAAQLIRQRRSCLALDGRTPIAAATLFNMLDCLLPRPGVPPWDALPWAPLVHPVLFVHRVADLAPGLYLFERSADVHDRLRAAMRDVFVSSLVPGCPDHLRLFRLATSDLRAAARAVSCHQEIASDGALSLGMLADFAGVLRMRGPWWYRRMFWEAGVLGQVLYLAAEAAGLRGTGIGCYFDDSAHDLLGLCGDEFQDLYHFTIGHPVDDPRLVTQPAYAHLRRVNRLISKRLFEQPVR
jgi:SagB-type dehydrogenase family enzyme